MRAPHKSILIILLCLILSSCSSSSKAAPVLTQICNDWNKSEYKNASIDSHKELSAKLKPQIENALELDKITASEFEVALTLMEDVDGWEKLQVDYLSKYFTYSRSLYLEMAIGIGKSKIKEIEKVVDKFAEVCEIYTPTKN